MWASLCPCKTTCPVPFRVTNNPSSLNPTPGNVWGWSSWPSSGDGLMQPGKVSIPCDNREKQTLVPAPGKE